MDYYAQFLKERREGKYEGCRYPNLVEIHGGMPTDYFAEVTKELMLAVFRGEEDLTLEEICRIARYNGIPLSVLTCPKVIMLDMGRRRHRKMVAEVDNLYIRLKCMARDGNQEAEKYLVVFQIKRAANLQIILAPYKIDVVLQPHYPETLLHITRTKILPCKLIAQEYSVSSYENGSSSSSIWQA